MTSGFNQRHENDIAGLLWIHRFGWLRSVELGRLMWPRDRYARTRADRIIRGWLARRLVIARQLPNGARRAVVLSESGARLLQAAGYTSARSGKDWGETDGEHWSPSTTWQHDLIAAGVLTKLFEDGYAIHPEKMLRRDNPELAKIPDGMATKGDQVIWLEVESTRKAGQAMRTLASTLEIVASGEYGTVSGVQPNVAMVAYVANARDERGHALNHRQRVITAVQKQSRRNVLVHWAQCQLVGCGVASITVERALVLADRASRVLEVLEARGWTEDSNGCLVTSYEDALAIVWNDEVMGWSYMLEGRGLTGGACQADSLTAAKRGCASLLAAR